MEDICLLVLIIISGLTCIGGAISAILWFDDIHKSALAGLFGLMAALFCFFISCSSIIIYNNYENREARKEEKRKKIEEVERKLKLLEKQ